MKRLALLALALTACATQPATVPPVPVAVATIPSAPLPPVESFRARAPEPSPARPYRFPDIHRMTLDNGMRVLVAEKRNAPLVTVRALIRSGADRDPAGHAGLAAFTADLLDEGAGKRSGVQLAEAIAQLGTSINVGADWDSSQVDMTVLASNLEPGMRIFADVVRRPTFLSKEFDRVKKERLNQILQQRDQAGTVAANQFNRIVYSGTPYENAVIGSDASLGESSLGDVRAFYRTHYIPNNVTLIVTGDVDAARATALAAELFGDWKRGAELPAAKIEGKALETARVFLVDRPQAMQSEIRIGHAGIARNAADYIPVLTMNSILGGIFGSRINLNLREKHGYTYGARSGWAFRRHAGPFVVSAPVRNAVTTESVTEILAELARIRSGDITEGELTDARNYLMGVFPSSVQTSSNLADRLGEIDLYGLDPDYFDHYRENIAAVTAGDIARVANRYIAPDKVAIVVVGKASEVKEGLMKLGKPLTVHDVSGAVIE